MTPLPAFARSLFPLRRFTCADGALVVGVHATDPEWFEALRDSVAAAAVMGQVAAGMPERLRR